MCPSFSHNNVDLHPLLRMMVERIRERRTELPDLVEFNLKPEFGEVFGELEGDA